jgi:hypothetical protein
MLTQNPERFKMMSDVKNMVPLKFAYYAAFLIYGMSVKNLIPFPTIVSNADNSFTKWSVKGLSCLLAGCASILAPGASYSMAFHR